MAYINKIGHVVLWVSDVDVAVDFYGNMLGMETVRYDHERGMAFMSFGTQHHDIALFKVKTPATRGSLGLAHVAMQVAGDVENLKEMHDRLVENQIDVRLTDHGMTKSVYFVDPDGNELELFIETMIPSEGKQYMAEGRLAGKSLPLEFEEVLLS